MSDKKPLFGVLAGEPEIIGERCADGGKCHHRCTDTCSRRSTCAPLSGSGLRFDWSTGEPSLSAFRDVAGDRFEVPVAGWSGPAQDEREAPVVVATAILGGIYHGGSGPELGEIDIEVCMPALEALQCETVNSSDDVLLPLMPVVQHERIVAALTRPAQTAPQPCAEVAAVGHWERSLVATWPADEDDAQGAWVIGTTDEDGNRYEVITIEADQYDAPGDSEKIARAMIALWSQAFAAPIAQTAPQGKFRMGDRVKKTGGSEWVGHVCGTYSTALTPEGYAVESEAHAGSVQIYPVTALEAVE